MLWFLTCVAALVGGYFIYGAFVEKVFGINEKRQTPAHTKRTASTMYRCPPQKFISYNY